MLSNNILNVIITLGKKGCYFSNGKEKYTFQNTNYFDGALTIGAGDNFVAGFISAKLKNKTVDNCIKYANNCVHEYLTYINK